MDKNSILILPEGAEIPENSAEIIGFLQNYGSLRVEFNKHEGPPTFENMSEFFKYAGNVRKNV